MQRITNVEGMIALTQSEFETLQKEAFARGFLEGKASVEPIKIEENEKKDDEPKAKKASNKKYRANIEE